LGGERGRLRTGVLDGGDDSRREVAVLGVIVGRPIENSGGLCCVIVRDRRALRKLLWEDLLASLLSLSAGQH